MNLIDALRTKKSLRRRDCKRHSEHTQSGFLGHSFVVNLMTGDKATMNLMTGYSAPILTYTDLLADDWVVEDEA